MITEFLSAATSVKAAIDIVKATLDTKTFNDVHLILSKVNFDLLAAQSAALQLQTDKAALVDDLQAEKKRVLELEQEIVRLAEWDKERGNYRLKEVAAGAFAYERQQTDGVVDGAGEPRHWLCCHCYDLRHKSILQGAGFEKVHQVYACPRCQARIMVRVESAGATVVSVGRGRGRFDGF